MNISVLGAGRWGTFITYYLSHKFKITLWNRDSVNFRNLQKTRSTQYFKLNENVEFTDDINEAAYNDIIIISVLTQKIYELMNLLKDVDLHNKKFIICMKGIYSETGERISQILVKYGVDINNIILWVGPGHVQNLINNIPSCMCMYSCNLNLCTYFSNLFSSELINISYDSDIVGAEICSAGKNVVGIIAGMLDALHLSSLKGVLMVFACNQFKILLTKLNTTVNTVYGLSFLGDFEATLFSEFSHNRLFGENFIKKLKIDFSAEGVESVKGLRKLCSKINLNLPILDFIYGVIFENKDFKIEFYKLLASIT